MAGLLAFEKASSISIVATADTEGHVEACQDCGLQTRLGGITRRATVLKHLRSENRSLLLADAGNAFFGAESIESRGEVMVCAYDKLGYDAVNLSYRDFRFGKETTLNLLKQAHFAAVSANLLDDQTGSLLAKPYVIKNVGGHRVALIGVTQSPAGLDYLTHLKEQLAGIRIQPPGEALSYWLAKAKAQSDIIILFYYGSEVGLQPIRNEFAKDVTIILVGGTLPEYLPCQSIPPVIGTYPRGRDVAYARFELKTREIEVTQLAIEPAIEPDPEMKRLLAKYLKSMTGSPSRSVLQSRRR